MQRRHFLALAGSAALAGCSGSGDGGDTPRSVGEKATYGGLEMSVTQVKTSSELSEVSDTGEVLETIAPAQGAVFALAYVRVEHVGEIEISFPDLGFSDDITMIYKRQVSEPELIGDKVGGIDTDLPQTYRDSVQEQDAGDGSFPGTVVEGWIAFELPEDFEQSDALIEIRYSDTSADSREFVWLFDS